MFNNPIRYPATVRDLLHQDFTIGYHHFEPLSTTFDRLINDEFDSFGRRVEVSEKDGILTLEFELPGFKQPDVDLQFKNSLLTIKAENARGKIERTITVGNDIDIEKVEAKLEDGLLVITLPRSEISNPR
jgi:HSP20 family protein